MTTEVALPLPICFPFVSLNSLMNVYHSIVKNTIICGATEDQIQELTLQFSSLVILSNDVISLNLSSLIENVDNYP